MGGAYWVLLQVRQEYGVKKDLLGLLEGRETYVIGKDGIVKMVRPLIFQWALEMAEAHRVQPLVTSSLRKAHSFHSAVWHIILGHFQSITSFGNGDCAQSTPDS